MVNIMSSLAHLFNVNIFVKHFWIWNLLLENKMTISRGHWKSCHLLVLEDLCGVDINALIKQVIIVIPAWIFPFYYKRYQTSYNHKSIIIHHVIDSLSLMTNWLLTLYFPTVSLYFYFYEEQHLLCRSRLTGKQERWNVIRHSMMKSYFMFLHTLIR